ncbi:MAG: DUF885 domain-containing protein [candidate division Zixibacteria bacterium]|nr:DUF885 domain-containing protein [candidate division Zixibacteria bacterium]
MAAASALDSLFADYWEFQMRTSPTWATYLGDHRFDDRLSDLSAAERDKELQALRGFLARSQAIQEAELARSDSLSAELFSREIQRQIDDWPLLEYTMPISQQNGPHIEFPELVTYHPFQTVNDCENFVKRLRAFPVLIDQTIANMQEGMKDRLVPAKVTMQATVPEIESQIVDDPAKAVLAGAIAQIDSGIPDTAKARLKQEIITAIAADVVPAYQRLDAFVKTEYIPACRDTVGILALPDGRERYRRLARRYTTTNLSPEEIFQIGQRELKLVHDQMEAIKDSCGFHGTIQEFAASLRQDPRFFYTTADSLVDGFKAILARMNDKLPLLFGRLPKAPYSFREIESYRAEAAPDAYYYGAPEDGSRPGYFYINTSHPTMRPKYTMEALAFHEAVPGHHLQLSIQQELTNLPRFRRHGGYTAFVEGWGLYSERLPKEVGFFTDPYSEFGRLTLEAWRCVRLIVDPGIHYYGWTRRQAVDFFRDNTALSDLNINSEVDRYIAWPGQALAYKIGQLKILELRQKAKDALGSRFDIRAFHDELLADGALPLDLLEAKMDRWLAMQVKSAHAGG